MEEWEKFKVGVPEKEFFRSDCIPFDTVSHTSHINPSLEIIQGSVILPSLVFDKSKLNTKRILVGWLSPNHWSPGYRYGNIKFEFFFNSIIEDKHFYWVESIAYNTTACRILITDIDRSAELKRYDPEKGNGPWWYEKSSNTHYYNNNYCLEFMVEDSILLSDACSIDFVDHHPQFCSVHRYDPPRCPEVGTRKYVGGALFFTRAIARSMDLSHYSSFFLNDEDKLGSNIKISFNKFV